MSRKMTSAGPSSPLTSTGPLIAVVELSLTTWLVGGMVPGIERDPLKKLVPDEEALLKLLHRWRDEAVKAGRKITRMVVAFEAGRDGFWLARWLRAREIEAYVIHPTSIAVSREHRRAKTDRLASAMCRQREPFGNAARATRLVSSGTEGGSCGCSDMWCP